MKLLIVEDEVRMADLLRKGLAEEGPLREVGGHDGDHGIDEQLDQRPDRGLRAGAQPSQRENGSDGRQRGATEKGTNDAVQARPPGEDDGL